MKRSLQISGTQSDKISVGKRNRSIRWVKNRYEVAKGIRGTRKAAKSRLGTESGGSVSVAVSRTPATTGENDSDSQPGSIRNASALTEANATIGRIRRESWTTQHHIEIRAAVSIGSILRRNAKRDCFVSNVDIGLTCEFASNASISRCPRTSVRSFQLRLGANLTKFNSQPGEGDSTPLCQ